MTEYLLQVRDLRVEFAQTRSMFAREDLSAVDGVDLQVSRGETVGLVGESGSGKSTLARAIMRLVPAAAGEVWLRDQNLLQLPAAQMRRERRNLQMVFQDPLASLNPRMSVGEALQEPLRIFEPRIPQAERRARVDSMLRRVGLGPESAPRYPREFSGGQCQRIAIARAMILNPMLLICDEPVSSLDVSIQGQIVNLLADMQRDTDAAMIFISHNLGVVRHISHRVYVIYRGRILEHAPSEELFARPRHPYTRALIAALPRLARLENTVAEASLGDPAVVPIPGGCAYRSRCPHAQPDCARSVPPLEPVSNAHWCACLHADEI